MRKVSFLFGFYKPVVGAFFFVPSGIFRFFLGIECSEVWTKKKSQNLSPDFLFNVILRRTLVYFLAGCSSAEPGSAFASDIKIMAFIFSIGSFFQHSRATSLPSKGWKELWFRVAAGAALSIPERLGGCNIPATKFYRCSPDQSSTEPF